MNPILVTGATGGVGSNVVRELQRRAVPVRAFVRDGARARAMLDDQMDCAVGDFTDPGSVRNGLLGVDGVLLCCANNPRQLEDEVTVIDAAVDSGIGRLVKISANGAQIGSPLEFWDAHGHIEQHLRESGLPSVVPRPGTHRSNLLAAADTIKSMGRLFAPAGDAKLSMVDPRDVAAVAALVLTEGGHDGWTYTLTGPDAVTYDEAAPATGRRNRAAGSVRQHS